MVDIPLELIEQFAKGNGVIFVGAGLSQGAGLPSFDNLICGLAAELDGCPHNVDPRDIAQYYNIEYGRRRLVERLRDQLDMLDVHPTPVHEMLIRLPVSMIFTTNYDTLLEQALRAARQSHTTVVDNVDASFWSTDRLQLVKLHGDLAQPHSIIITSQDYERFALICKSLADILKVTLQTRTVLFLGYAAADPDLRLILTQVHEESGQFARNLYTVQFGLSPWAAKDLERRGLKVVDLGEHSDAHAQNEVLCAWLEMLCDHVAAEAREPQPMPSREFQTALESLSDEIQTWLDAMGYRVTVEACSDRCIDLDATLQRGLEEQHVLVRCVAGEISVDDLKALEGDIAARTILRGWAVSDRRIPPSTRAYADDHPSVRPFSLADFVSQIFGPYFGQLYQLVEESDIPRYYVDLACYRRVLDQNGNEIGRDRYDVIDSYVDDWLRARDANHLSILGEFGSGKTWFCRHYAYRQLKRYLADPANERIPIMITLRDYVKQVEIGSLIRKLLDEQGVQLGGGLKAFEELNRRGKLLLIFDGFDEMAVKVDYQTVVDYFWELAKVVVPGSKALLTCRTGYFRYATEAEKVMHGEELGRQMIHIQPPRFEVIYLEPFTEAQIREVVTRRSSAEAAEAVLNNRDLATLARQPVLIEMLMEALPGIESGAAANKSEVYRLAVDRWLERDIGTGRTFMDKWDKLFFMMELAWEMISTGKPKIHYKELPERINCHFGLEQLDDKDHYDYDIRTNSFLRRDSRGYYEFTHRSLAEYFIALKFGLELNVAKPDYVIQIPMNKLEQYVKVQVPDAWRVGKPDVELNIDWGSLGGTVGYAPLSWVVREFLMYIASDISVMWEIVRQTEGGSLTSVGYIGGNIATLLRLQGESFDVPRGLAGTVLAGADLENANLTGANLKGSDLYGINLSGCTLKDADFREADLTNARMGEIKEIKAIAYHPQQDVITVGSGDGVIWVWKPQSGDKRILRGHSGLVRGLQFSPDGAMLASSSYDKTILIWNWESGEVLAELKGHTYWVDGISFSSDGQLLASGSDDHTVRLWDLGKYQPACSPLSCDGIVFNVSFSPSGTQLAAAVSTGEVVIWDLETWQPIKLVGHTRWVHDICYSPNGRFIATAGRDHTVRIWDAATYAEKSVFCRLEARFDSVCYSPSGDFVAAGDTSGDVWLWNPTTDASCQIHAHSKSVYGLVYNHDGTWLVSAGLDGRVRIWEVSAANTSLGRLVKELSLKMNCQGMRIGGARGLDALAPDGKGTLRDWLVARGAVE